MTTSRGLFRAWALVAAESVQAVGLRVAVLGFSVPGPSRDVRGVA